MVGEPSLNGRAGIRNHISFNSRGRTQETMIAQVNLDIGSCAALAAADRHVISLQLDIGRPALHRLDTPVRSRARSSHNTASPPEGQLDNLLSFACVRHSRQNPVLGITLHRTHQQLQSMSSAGLRDQILRCCAAARTSTSLLHHSLTSRSPPSHCVCKLRDVLCTLSPSTMDHPETSR